MIFASKMSRSSPQIKSSMNISHIRSGSGQQIRKTIRSMTFPLIAPHAKPDPDAIGASVAMAIYLKTSSIKSAIFVKEADKLPPFLMGIIKEEALQIINSITSQYGGLIVLDTAGEQLMEDAVKELLHANIKTVDIDHHIGEKMMASPSLTLTSDKVSSVSELLAKLFEGEISKNMAAALLAGILFDTKNLHFMVGKETLSVVAELEMRAGIKRDELYAQLNDLSAADRTLIDKCLSRLADNRVTINGIVYNIKTVVVTKDELSTDNRNWRKALQDEMGFGHKADIVLLVYYDPVKGKHRGSLSLYNNGTKLDLRPTAKAISEGGGHPGAVGFDLSDEHVDIPYILKMLEEHGIPLKS
jgi:nanoRNase/pAp phosphatase (c-di-AMP/oligoRNAs hydrolase)